jgi:predicted amidophosphoribosyltransferase
VTHIIRACARCGAGVSGSRRYCAPCADERRIEAKQKQNRKRQHLVPDADAVRYVGTKRGMLKVRRAMATRRAGRGAGKRDEMQ